MLGIVWRNSKVSMLSCSINIALLRIIWKIFWTMVSQRRSGFWFKKNASTGQDCEWNVNVLSHLFSSSAIMKEYNIPCPCFHPQTFRSMCVGSFHIAVAGIEGVLSFILCSSLMTDNPSFASSTVIAPICCQSFFTEGKKLLPFKKVSIGTKNLHTTSRELQSGGWDRFWKSHH